ncbi:MAG: hypothetical protein AAF684_01195 [Pseudomonadota bacterium]
MRIAALSLAVLLALPAASFAAEGGLPQLNTDTYATQIFWALVSFGAIYLLMAKLALPRIGAVLQDRSQQIDGDLDAAGKLKADADEAEAKYHAALEGSKDQARTLLREASDAAAAEATAKEADFGATLAARAEEAASRIDAARKTAMTEIRPVAAALAVDTVKKLARLDIDAAGAQSAVDTAMGRRG